jgi:hypothetical protein
MRRSWGHLTGLRWSRPRFFRREYELRSGGELVATLGVRGVLHTSAVVESGEGAWTFTRTGFFRHGATIRGGAEGAEYRGDGWGRGGELTLASGRSFRLRVNFWMTLLEVTAGGGELLVAFRRRGLCGGAADVEILPAARALHELPLLVTFGWFLFVMLEQDAGAAVVTG